MGGFDYVKFLAEGWGLAGLIIAALSIVIGVLYRDKQKCIDARFNSMFQEKDKRIEQERQYACKYIELAERVVKAIELLAEFEKRRSNNQN